MMNENTSFFNIMEMQNNRLNARRKGINPNYSYSEVLTKTVDMAMQTQNLGVMEKIVGWVPSDGRIIDSNEDLSNASMYAKQCLEGMQREENLGRRM
ncbi:MAG: hypothetical protein NC181_05725 [Clostridium sp.]|nr:hypothetical protein [Clostridium sp.]MCM1444760.1 hypothetical protein [Candidatus Amulumruptor caecigallinarius]